jgi:hypothetical protein
MDFMRVYNDVSLRSVENMVSANNLLPGKYYVYQYNDTRIILLCLGHWAKHYIQVKNFVYEGRVIDNSMISVLYTLGGRFYKVEHPLFKEIQNIRVTSLIPSLRILSYNQLDNDTKIEYSYAANVYGQFPPISSG